jgi:hypothetical protein
LLVPDEDQGQWLITLDSYDAASTDPSNPLCQLTQLLSPLLAEETAALPGTPVTLQGNDVSAASMAVYWCDAPFTYCPVPAPGRYEGGGVFDAVAMATNPTYDETQEYQVHFSSSTAATITVIRLRDYHYLQCVIHWYGTMGR